MEKLPLSRLADDVHDVPVARHAGSLSRFSWHRSQIFSIVAIVYGDSLQHWSHCRRNYFRPIVGTAGEASHYDRRADISFTGDSVLGVRQLAHRPGHWRFSDA